MAFYSFIVVAPDVIAFKEHRVILDSGRNVFNSVVEDLDAFKKDLIDHGVKVLQVNRLDDFEQVTPDMEKLPR
jgi:hypothetical protein